MSIPQPPQPAKLIISLLLKERSRAQSVVGDLVDAFGPIDMISPWFDFDYTTYYEPEMGSPLYRRVLSMKRHIQQDDLTGVKLATNGIEAMHSVGGNRQVNLDPGYVTAARFVLGTGKDYSHRIYLSKGIYADLTLVFQQGEFSVLPWTYPDYGSDQMREYLKCIRKRYLFDLKRLSSAPSNASPSG